MNTATAKQAIKQCFQSLTDEQLQQYHLNHDYFTGRPLGKPQVPHNRVEVDPSIQKKQRNLSRLNEVLYPTPTLGSVMGDALAALKLVPEKSISTDTVLLKKPSEGLVDRAKSWFDQYQVDGLESLLPAQADQLTEMNLAVIKRAFSHNTVLIQNVCMLSPFWLRSPLEWDEQSDGDLLEYLFVQYDAPAFLKSCWYDAADEESVRWLLCFVMYAQGGSLKALAKHFNWTLVSNKLWHELFSCPTDLSPQHAVLYAEFYRLGGWTEDFSCLMENESYVIDLLEPISEESRDFWYDTCRWTISHQLELAAEENTKVLWWARHQFTEHARNGESYRLQGRSQAKVLDSIAEYELEKHRFEQARARMAARAVQVSMARGAERERLRLENIEEQAARRERQHFNYFDYEEMDATWASHGWNWSTFIHGKNWRFTELTTSQQLRDEGNAMSHCVGSYTGSCVNQDSAIFSLRDEAGRVATVEVDPVLKEVNQAQGKCNSDLRKAAQSVIEKWIKEVVLR
ncbi:PcfJ domain-containing protein [Leucothrix arctica]|nr:PcfJ domain-containing protein [Leucothrix arctica]